MTAIGTKYLQFALAALVLAFAADASIASGTSPSNPEIPFETATVQSRDDGNFAIAWKAGQAVSVRVFAGDSPDKFDLSHVIASGDARGNVVVHLQGYFRPYFELVPDHGAPLVITDRSVRLPHAANFRDTGGYRTADGHWVRMGLVYRSNALSGLSAAEIAQLSRLNLKAIDDLRTADERSRAPDPTVAGANHVVMDMLSGDKILLHRLAADRNAANPEQAASAMLADTRNIYREFVRLPSAQISLRMFFVQLADRRNLPVVFHCTAGKDRTGWTQAVLLTILGVPRGKIMDDYRLTNVYYANTAVATGQRIIPGINAETARRLMAADPVDLDAAFDEVRLRFGTFDNYLHKGLGLDDRTLAAIRRNLASG